MNGGPAERFLTHQNYIRAFACLAGWSDPDRDDQSVLADVGARVVSSESYRTQQGRSRDLTRARASMTNAWSTEFLLAITPVLAPQDPVIRIANSWAVVQLYYALYHACQALTMAKGSHRSTSHEATRARYLELWVYPSGARDLLPLSVAYGAKGPINVPAGSAIEPIESWTACTRETCCSHLYKSLRKTREDMLGNRFGQMRVDKRRQRKRDWEDEERQRLVAGRKPRRKPTLAMRPTLSAEEKAQANGRLRAVSMLDYLYRLRVRSNYHDATMFTDRPQGDLISMRVHSDLVRLAAVALLIHELHMRQVVGSREFGRWCDEWLETLGNRESVGLRSRRAFL
jgi:hypothetical protein